MLGSSGAKLFLARSLPRQGLLQTSVRAFYYPDANAHHLNQEVPDSFHFLASRVGEKDREGSGR